MMALVTMERQGNFLFHVTCFIIWNLILVTVAQENEDPCDATNSVILPKSESCLVYDNRGKTWVEAAQVCERNGGKLYRLTNGQLRMEQNVRDCLEAHPTSTGNMDFWIGFTGKWTPQWYWINGDMLSPLATCAANSTGLSTRSNDICRKYLSIDHCVSVCKKEGAEYVAVVHDMTDPCCWCSARATPYPTTCPVPVDRFRFGRSHAIWMYRTFSEQDSGILLDTSEIFTLDTLCGVIDESTVIRRELSSQPCFTKNAYICNLGSVYRPCKFFLNDDCMWFGEDKLNWVEAQAECQRKGGNLVSAVKDLDNFELFQPHVKGSHWIGASNYYWDSKPVSDTFGTDPESNYGSVACGHMHNEDGVGNWDWSDAKCDTSKPFVCKYKSRSKNLDATAAFRCPWPVGGVIGGVTPNTTIVKLPTSSGGGGSTFPLAAIIAASIMALLILTCAILTIGFSRKKKRFVSNMRKSLKSDGFWAISKAPRQYYQLWNTPYSYYSDRKSDLDDSISTIHTGVFNEGSMISVPGYGYDEQGKIYMMDGGDYLYGKINRTHSERSNFIHPHVLSDPIAEEAEETEVKTNLSSMSAMHSTNSLNPKEYMTLRAQMNFGDENVIGKSTLRNRPEVALVTSDVDLNFTVNHALPKKRTFSNASERTIEEIELPRGTTVELPTKLKREDEDDVLY